MFTKVYKHTCTFPHTRSEQKELLIIGEKALFIIGGKIPGIRISTGNIRIGKKKNFNFHKRITIGFVSSFTLFYCMCFC